MSRPKRPFNLSGFPFFTFFVQVYFGQVMKIIFYKTLLTRARNITPNEKILYSFLVAKSIVQIDVVFDTQGQSINMNNLFFYLNANQNKCDLCELNNTQLSKELNITRQTIITSLKHLQEQGYIGIEQGQKYIYVSRELIKNGYFELSDCDRINGELLIFYSFLIDKSKHYGYCLDTYITKLADLMGKTPISIKKMLHKLYKLGLAKRLDNNRLMIL